MRRCTKYFTQSSFSFSVVTLRCPWAKWFALDWGYLTHDVSSSRSDISAPHTMGRNYLPEAGGKSRDLFPAVCIKGKWQHEVRWFMPQTSLSLHPKKKRNICSMMQTSQCPTILGMFSVLNNLCFCSNRLTGSLACREHTHNRLQRMQELQTIRDH